MTYYSFGYRDYTVTPSQWVDLGVHKTNNPDQVAGEMEDRLGLEWAPVEFEKLTPCPTCDNTSCKCELCVDCGKPANYELFGCWFCPEHEPKPTAVKMGDWFVPVSNSRKHRVAVGTPASIIAADEAYYHNVYRPAMRRILQAREDGLEAVKAEALTEMRGE